MLKKYLSLILIVFIGIVAVLAQDTKAQKSFFSVKSQNIESNAGYWKMTGITGLKEHIKEESSGWSFKDKFSGDNTATFYSYTKQLEKQLQFSWSALPDIVKPNQEYPITIEGRQIFRNPKWEGSNSLCVGFRGAATLLGEVYVGAEGDKGPPMKKTAILKVSEGNTQSSVFYVHFSLIGNFNPDTYTYVYEWIPLSSTTTNEEIAETWKGTFNGYSVVLEISKIGTGYSGRFNVNGNPWEEMLDIQVNGNNISFRRAAADQRYTGSIGNEVMEGTFSQGGSGKYIWSVKRIGSTQNTVPAGNTSNQVEKELFFNGNDYGVGDGGKSPSFMLSNKAKITFIMTYHWNSGRGATAGTITLIGEDGKQYGPWQVTVNNKVYWEIRPNITLPAGKYRVLDSEPSTWSQNSGSSGFGMVRIKGYEIK